MDSRNIERSEVRLDAFSDGNSDFVAMGREQYGDGLDLDIYWEAAADARADFGMGALHGLDGPKARAKPKPRHRTKAKMPGLTEMKKLRKKRSMKPNSPQPS